MKLAILKAYLSRFDSLLNAWFFVLSVEKTFGRSNSIETEQRKINHFLTWMEPFFGVCMCVLVFFLFFGKRPKNNLILLRFDLRILMCQTRKLLSQGCHSISNLHHSHIGHIMAIQSWWYNGWAAAFFLPLAAMNKIVRFMQAKNWNHVHFSLFNDSKFST